ncbi:DUF4811 domain-containing protein [Secundilactobacillus oryzae]|nr:DUF4811 domain-containing protein [Secundilactobacillus oryzae]
MILNFNSYLGMKEIHSTETKPLATVGQNGALLQYRQLGTKGERVYFYRDNPLEKRVKHTDATTSRVTLNRGAKTDSVRITRTYRVYRNEEWRLLFANGMPNHQLVRSHYTFSVKANEKIQKMTIK